MDSVTMSNRELERLEVLRQIKERRVTRVKAGALLGLTERQVRRLYAAYEAQGAVGLVSKRRGRPSNRTLPDDFRDHIVGLVKTKYADFGPKLANEKLLEL